MPELIKTKLRRIGTSFGVLLPKEVIYEKNLKEGDEIELAVLKKDLSLLKKAFGMAKEAKQKFVRDRTDRIERLYGDT